jgi:glycosyltransferase involved in cell wall biosynthesis
MTRGDESLSNMRILWLSNKVLCGRDNGSTGAWLDAMAQGLIDTGEVDLGNISQGRVAKTTRWDMGLTRQWAVPSDAKPSRHVGLPPERYVAEILKSVEEFSPHLIHVWGTENFWGLLTARKLIRQPALLEMQGLKGVYARVFSGGLSFREQMACIGIKEIIRRSSIFQERQRFEKWGTFEREIILNHSLIATQSAWMEAWVRAINATCRTFHNDLALRASFHVSTPWQYCANPVIFCSAAYPVPYKGLHVAVKAVAILKQRFPDIRLRIAGAHQRPGIRQDGYVAWLNRQVKALGVESNVVWLGALTASQIVDEMCLAAAMALPTFIENCSTAMQEAMAVGIPLVASYVGGLPSLAQDEESALFFPPGDEAMCAFQLERLLMDRALAEQLSRRSREIALARNDRDRIVRRQIEIYRQVLEETNRQQTTESAGQAA